MKFFEELKKRNVYKVATAYAISSWLIIQVVNTIGPNLDWPDSVPSLITRILIVGFPLALLLAWLFELTPQGLRLIGDKKVIDDKIKGRRLNYFIIGVLALTVCFLLVERLFFAGKNEVNQKQVASMVMIPDFTSSIAVLAFDDMSPNKDQEYFSDGISEEILNRLTKYKDLKVISRTSSFAYKDKDVTIDIIGKELDVAYVLEGSIRKSGDTFRTTVQLIDTRDGSHIWSDTFDRQVEDALFVQDEIAEIVANRLQLTLLNEDVLLRKVDPEAYQFYLKSLEALRILNDSTTTLGDSLIRRSLDIDPGYAPAWTILSQTTFHKGIYYYHLEREKAIDMGLSAARRALELDSSINSSKVWIANWQWHNREGTKSLGTLEKMLANSPNSASINRLAAHAYTRVGMPEKALLCAYRLPQLDPNDWESYWWIFKLERYLGNNEKAAIAMKKQIEVYEQQTGLEPDIIDLVSYYELTGDLKKAIEINAKEPNRYLKLHSEFLLEYKDGQVEKAENILNEFLSIPNEEILESTEDDDLTTHYSFLAEMYATKGDLDSAFNALNQAFDDYVVWTEELWTYPAFKNLHDDPRWSQFLDRLGKYFNFNYKVSE
ncbi:hypothetical protein [Croceivirga thetidis]|uniref:Tetratricopeptide repeat protein n=1 Tax=Croceivirga thetidis TaxID=2721623 RepID=A0ABX1GP33_9FLAO|nr:hypothetical protein [Croceivirga thetidis]NKI31678.1 hypothetical protein [Croceivirga thetidis]